MEGDRYQALTPKVGELFSTLRIPEPARDRLDRWIHARGPYGNNRPPQRPTGTSWTAPPFGFLGLKLRGELVEEPVLTFCELRSRDFQRKPLGTIYFWEFFHRA